MFSLDKILSVIHAPSPLDFVSIDVEGTEIDVLKGFDIYRYSPRIMIIEANDEKMDNAIDNYMKDHGYVKAGRLAKTNNFYCKNFIDALIIAFSKIECELRIKEHLSNTLQNNLDDIQVISINQPSMAKQNIYRHYSQLTQRIKSILR